MLAWAQTCELQSVGTAKAQHSDEKMFANVYIRICPLKSARIVKTSLQFFSDKTETTWPRKILKTFLESTNLGGFCAMKTHPLLVRFLGEVSVQS